MKDKGFLIAAASSNSGKTTLTMGLLRALRNRGLTVQPYKCGPDYIDTMFHEVASGRESVNLDTFMSSHAHVRDLFNHYGEDADIRIVEGVMGMFDGYDRWHGSSAEVAMLLDLPVILVVNAKSVAYSVAPLIYGFKNYRPEIRLAGVIFNMVASESHYAYLKAACEDAGVECLGYLPRNSQLVVPGRHLGLTIEAKDDLEELISLAASEVEKHVDLDKIGASSCPSQGGVKEVNAPLLGGRVIAIAQDEAFNFTYRANIDALRTMGDVVFFSPINDGVLPECDSVYLPGGYPELFATQLQNNISMRQSIKDFAERGGHIFAECGGFMYLCHDIDGVEMCGVFPFSASMLNARLHLGYRQLRIPHEQPCQQPSQCLRGHEFHYSDIINIPDQLPPGITSEQCQLTAKGTPATTSLYRYKNVTAGYTHWYWAENLDIWKYISNFVP